MRAVLSGLYRANALPSAVLPAGGRLSLRSFRLVSAYDFPTYKPRKEDVFQEAVGRELARARKETLQLIAFPLGPATQVDAGNKVR
jgi:hypothetical protein